MTEEIAYYRGVRLEDLTREELIDAIKQMGRIQAAFYAKDAIHSRALERVEMIKRGEEA